MLFPGLLMLATLAGRPCAAQDPLRDYNRARAYSHFLNSNAPVRSYSGIQPGAAWEAATPWEDVRYYRSPYYYRELITPYGRQVDQGPQRIVTEILPRPVLVPLPVPGPLYPYPGPR
jgi:hypothetical protein